MCHLYFVIFPRKLLRMIPNVPLIFCNLPASIIKNDPKCAKNRTKRNLRLCLLTHITDLHPTAACQAFDMQFLPPFTVFTK